MNNSRKLVRIARRIREALVKMHRHRYTELLRHLNHSLSQFQQIDRAGKLMDAALDHHWMMAVENCRERMNRDLYTFTHHISDLHRLSQTPQLELPSLRYLYDELACLQEEFDAFHYDFRENTLSVQTEPVELEGVYLGVFEIRLEIQDLYGRLSQSSYYVIARDRRPASSSDETTHPHISADRLCEGDGAAAINMALYQGRLVDFFTLVSSILHTYNPNSAYVKLEDWDDRSCYECGTGLPDDGVYYCHMCDYEFCDCCANYCHACNTTGCLNCLDRCPVCDERICSECLKTCRECGGKCCLDCMDEPEQICPNCKETESEENSNDEFNENNECAPGPEGSQTGKTLEQGSETDGEKTIAPAAV